MEKSLQENVIRPSVMISLYKNEMIDRSRWDYCISNSPGVKPYACSWYLDIIAPGWEALVEDEYESVFPLPASRKYGISYLSTPPFVQRLGLFSKKPETSPGADDFLRRIPARFRLVDLCIQQATTDSNFRVTPRVNLELDLSIPYDQISAGYSEHCRRNISISKRFDHKLTGDISARQLIDLFRKNRGREISELRPIHYLRLENLMNYCFENGRGRITGIRDHSGELISGIFLVESDRNRVMLFVVNTAEGREKRAGYFIVDELIRESAGSDTILDFEGSSIPSVASFMESFGCRNVPFYRIYSNRLPFPLRLFK